MAAQIAYVHAYRGETNATFEWLERAYAQKDSGLPYIRTYGFLMQKVAADPRYSAFLRRMQLGG